MMKQIYSLAIVFFTILGYANAFSIVSRSSSSPSMTTSNKPFASPKTCLYADAADESGDATSANTEDKEEAKVPSEDHQLPDESGSDILNSPAFLKRKIDVLKSDIEKADATISELDTAIEAGKAEWADQLDKLTAEYENINNRMSEQSSKGDIDATIQVVRKMLEVLDNYDRAFQAVTPTTDEERSIEEEYKATYEKILETFRSMNVKEVDTVGKEFDYEVHQAVMQKPTDEYDEGIVSEELQKGYILDDKLIRAAMVVVAC